MRIPRAVLNLAAAASSAMSACPDHFDQFEDRCFQLNKRSHYTQAQETCRQQGGLLSKVENMSINALLCTEDAMWIGLGRKASSQQWQWEDGTTLDGTMFQNWARGKPQPADGETCVISKSAADGSCAWYAVPCEENNAFYCEKPAVERDVRDEEAPAEPDQVTEPAGAAAQPSVRRPESSKRDATSATDESTGDNSGTTGDSNDSRTAYKVAGVIVVVTLVVLLV